MPSLHVQLISESATGVGVGRPPQSGTAMPIPAPRGPVSELLIAVLSGARSDTGNVVEAAESLASAQNESRGILYCEDAQICLTLLYELHLQGVSGVSDEWEWNLDLLRARAALERPFEQAIRDLAGAPTTGDKDVVTMLFDMTAPDGGPSLSKFMATEASLAQFRELLVHRSLYQLREADLHTFGIPRLAGATKAALVEVQADEYGGGRPERMHSTLFATTMRELGLSDRYAHYLDAVPALTLSSLNALSLFGLHRRHLGALVGHLCAVETTSALPSKLYSAGLRRLGFGRTATLFFDEHVEADSVHEQIVCRDLAGGLVQHRPGSAADIVFGAAACLAFDRLTAEHIAACWARGESSLLTANV